MDRQVKKSNSKKEKEEQKRILARRPLHTPKLEPPEYTVEPEFLLKDGGYYEKDVRVICSFFSN